MPVIVKEDPGTDDFEPAPAGRRHAVLVDVVDLGLIDRGFKNKTGGQKLTPTVELRFQLAEKMKDGRPYLVTQWYTNSINERAKLSEHLESWFSKKIAKEKRLAGIDIEGFIGFNAELNVIHYTNKRGKTRACIDAILPPPTGAPRLVPMDYVREINRPPEEQRQYRRQEPQPESHKDEEVPF